MASTDSVYVDTTVVKDKLSLFSNLKEELSTIQNLSNLSSVMLVPKDFYNGCSLEENYDIGSNNKAIFDNYYNVIENIKKYMDELEKINGEGNVTQNIIDNSDDITGVVTAAGSTVLFNALGNNNATVVETGTTVSDHNNNDLNSNGLNVNDTDSTNNEYDNDDLDSDGLDVDDTDSTNNEYDNDDLDSNGLNVDDTDSNSGNYDNSDITDEQNQVDTNENTSGNGKIDNIDNSNNNIDNSNNKIEDINEINGNRVVDKIVDANGNVTAIAIEIGNATIWLPVVNGKVIIPENMTNGNYHLDNDITIKDGSNDIVIKANNYTIKLVVYNENGDMSIVRFQNGEYVIELHLDNNGNIIKVEYLKEQNGVFIINGTHYEMYDINGNVIGTFKDGKYFIYEAKYDQNGKLSAIRLSPNGKAEVWLYIGENTKEEEYSFFNTKQTSEKTNVSLFDKSKGLLGLLGILFVAAGATVIVKKRKKKKEEDEYEDTSSYDWTESNLSAGNYPIYDVKRDETGNVREARISPHDDSDEYWIEV